MVKRVQPIMILVAVAALCACALCASCDTSSSTSPSDQASQQGGTLSQDAQAAQEDSSSSDYTSAQFDAVATQSFTTRTWAVVGDSLTEHYFRSNKYYYEYVAEDLGCTVVNYGVSGSGYMEPGRSESFCDRIELIDLDDVDCLTIFGSFNDLGEGYYLGTAYDETQDTIGGCMNLTIERIIEKNPAVSIGIATPTPWRTGYGYTSDGEGSFDLISRWECDEYVELLKEVAKRHRIPVLDLYENFGLDPDDEAVRERFYVENGRADEGGVHPNAEGHKHMYPMWREFVKSLMPSDAVG